MSFKSQFSPASFSLSVTLPGMDGSDDGEEEMDTSWIGEATLEVAEIGAVLTDLCTMLGYKEEAPEE